MNKKPILSLLESYQPVYADEIRFRNQIIYFITHYDDFALRSNSIGQLTCSAWVVNKERTKALLIHHKKLDKWLQIGGHIEDTDKSIEETVLREVREESGLENLKLLSSDSLPNSLYDLDIHTIPIKNQIKDHIHFDIRLILEADENELLIPQSEEVLDIKWYSLEEIDELAESTIYEDRSLKRMVDKMRKYTFYDSHSKE